MGKSRVSSQTNEMYIREIDGKHSVFKNESLAAFSFSIHENFILLPIVLGYEKVLDSEKMRRIIFS